MPKLPPEIDSRSRDLVRVLLESSAPVSGRRVADLLGISPTTATKRLKVLLDLGLVKAQSAGAAVLWCADEAHADVRALRRDLGSRRQARFSSNPAPADTLAWALPVQGTKSTCKAVVLTALPLEYAAMRTHLGEVTRWQSPSGTRYEVGVVRGEHLDWEVYLAEIGMGNSGAAVEVAGAIENLVPQLVLFVGVAGGLKPRDQSHGDIVVASMVYNVHSAKIGSGSDGETQIRSRPHGVRASHRLVQLVRAVGRTEWTADSHPGGWEPHPASALPIAHLGPVVAGEVVLADADSDLRKLIAERFNDAVAIDMESAGVYESAYRYALPVLSVRGLSDLIGDKNPDADRELQPLAAANAAAFAIALLKHADEDDVGTGFPPGGPGGEGTPSRPPVPQLIAGAEADVTAAEDSLACLAPPIRPWWRRLRARVGPSADTAIAELAERSAAAAGWIGRLRHRPPAWLRDDIHGDAWALVAWFAESHGSPHAAWLHDEAAVRADRIGEDIIAGLHRLDAAMALTRYPPAAQHGQEDTARQAPEVARTEALRRLADDSLRTFGPLTAVYRSVVNDDAEATLEMAPAAMEVLGIAEPHLAIISEKNGVPRSREADTGPAEAIFTELVETDPDIVDQVRSSLLVTIGYALLIHSQAADSALVAFAKARDLAPDAAAPLLGLARARFRMAVAADATTQVSSDLAEAEELALLARDRRRAWKADGGDAVAIAVRARAASDPRGALRLALPAPRGVATDPEARNPEVREAGAVAAIYAGEPVLAAELAASISDPVERDLVRAAALAELPGAADEVVPALRRALAAAPMTRPDQRVRALMGLVQHGAPIAPDQLGSVAPELAQLRDTDPEAADIVQASAALRAGQLQQALVIARQYPTSIPAVEIAARAAAEAGNPEEAFSILDRAGRTQGDEALRTQAMFLAADAGLNDQAQEVANRLVLSRDAETRRRALEVRLDLAGRSGIWEEIADLGRRLLDDSTFDLSDVRRVEHVVQYRWAVAGAEFNLRRPERARVVLDEPDMLVPRNSTEALLLLAVLRATADPPTKESASPNPVLAPEMLERALAIASAFPDDEDVVASALKIVLMCSGPDPLPDALLAQARSRGEAFFERFPDSSQLRQVTIGEDLSGLAEYMRASYEPGAEQVVDLARQVWLGIYPQGLLASVIGRSYAETLIKRIAGCLVASTSEPAVAETEEAASRSAREAGAVVIDTSALVLLDSIGGLARVLMAQFGRVFLPAGCRDDILEARNGLALKSGATLGWNPREQRPQLTEIAPETVENWAEAGARLAQRLAMVVIIPAGRAKPGWSWDDSLLLASTERHALWADDFALRQAARSEGVPAFGTLDLVTDLVHSGQLDEPTLSRVIDAFQHAYIVDLPRTGNLIHFAASDGWRPGGYAALLLARPRFWSQPADGFAQYMRLMRALPPTEATPEAIAEWGAAAMTGLAWAIPPPARPRAVAGLLAWTVLNGGGAAIFPTILEAGEQVMAAAAPAGDLLAHTVAVLTETLSSIMPADQVGVIFTSLLAKFDKHRRAEAMQCFLSVPRAR